jgi:hypothetical protein
MVGFLSLHFQGVTEEKYEGISVRIVGVQAEVRKDILRYKPGKSRLDGFEKRMLRIIFKINRL